MSEAQERYEYDPDYDEEPTEDAWTVRQGVVSRRYFVETVDEIGTRVIADCSDEDRARLIAVAGTAAQEVKEMGYDPVAAVEALPKGLQAARKAIIDLQEAHTSGPPEDSAEAAAQAASHRLKVFMAEAGADEAMIPGDASVALASAEGNEE